MSENILRQLWFDCYALDMSPAKVARRYDAKFGVLPLMLLCPVGHLETITEQGWLEVDALTTLGKIVDEHPCALGMWYAGPVTEEVPDGKAD